MNEFFEKLSQKSVKLIDGVEDERELVIRFIIAVALFVLVVIFRNKLSGVVVSVFKNMFKKLPDNIHLAIEESLAKPLSVFLVVLSLFCSSEILVPSGQVRIGFQLILKLGLILFVSWFAINYINSDYSFAVSKNSSKTKKTAVRFISNILKVAIAIVAAILVLEQFGISATRIFAALGIGGVAIAFACKDAVENMLSGFIIIYDKPFEVDDCIDVDGTIGTVEDITIRTTRLRCNDGSEVIYPNTTMANAKIINWTRIEKRTVNETIWINYCHSQQEIEEFCNGVKGVINTFDEVAKDDVRVNFADYGTHALEINVIFFVTTVAAPDYQKLKSDINTAIKKYADESDIQLAFTSQTIYFGDELKINK